MMGNTDREQERQICVSLVLYSTYSTCTTEHKRSSKTVEMCFCRRRENSFFAFFIFPYFKEYNLTKYANRQAS